MTDDSSTYAIGAEIRDAINDLRAEAAKIAETLKTIKTIGTALVRMGEAFGNHLRPPQVVAPVNHDMLDAIAKGHDNVPLSWVASLVRESECIEFVDKRDGMRYEIVIRPIDELL